MRRLLLNLITLLCCAAPCIAQIDLKPKMIFPVDYLPTGTHVFDLMVENAGSSFVPWNGFKVGWSLDNGPVNEVSTLTPTYPINANSSSRVTGNFSINISTTGTHKLKAWTRVTNGTDANTTNDTITKTIKVLPYVPVKNVLFEVFKHQGCCPCVDAAAYEDTAVSSLSNYAVANLYTAATNDPLFNVDADVVDNQFGLAHPTVFFDRYQFPYSADLENNFFTLNNDYLLENMNERNRYYEPLEVSVASATFDNNTRVLKVKLKARVYDTIQGNYRFNLYVTEDSVKEFQACFTPPNDYWHMHVLRHMAGGPWGQASSLPATLYPNQDYYYDFSYTIPANYKTQHITFIGLVQQFNNDKLNSRVLNCKKISFNSAMLLSTEGISKKENLVKIYPNPATDKLYIEWTQAPPKSVAIDIIDLNGRIVQSDQGNKQIMEIDIKTLPAGNYQVRLSGSGAIFTYSVIKQ